VLYLDRYVDERIMIGHDIVITVVAVRGDQVRLGIAAPIEIPIDRLEIHLRKQREGVKKGGPR
jgi:carbon storage regulator